MSESEVAAFTGGDVAAFTSGAVKELRALLARRRDRRGSGRFVVEGPVLVAEAVRAGFRIDRQFVPTSAAPIDGAGDVVWVADDVLGRLGSTQQPQPPIAIVGIPERDASSLLTDAALVVVLDQMSDPGNLGTIIRSAEAAGVDSVVLTAGSVDQYSPKVVRSSAGALFHVPVVEASLDEVAGAGLNLIGTTSHDRTDRSTAVLHDADFGGRAAIVIGNEAAGLPEAWNDHVGPIRRWVTIPHHGRSESLNAAMAATLLVFEAARQRR
ncbi:MAG: RNA methyltransferase [Actinomycetota bacterium]